MSHSEKCFLIIMATLAIVSAVLIAVVPACEPVKIRPTIEFCDVWFWQPIKSDTTALDFHKGDTIYVTNDSGRVIGRGLVKTRFPDIGANVHVYGDEPMTKAKDGPTNGDILHLRWSRLPGCGELPTTDPIKYGHWGFMRVYPVLSGD